MPLLNVPKKEIELNTNSLVAAKKLVLNQMRLTKPIKLAIESIIETTSVGGKWIMIWFYYYSSPNTIHPIYYNYAFSLEEWENACNVRVV